MHNAVAGDDTEALDTTEPATAALRGSWNGKLGQFRQASPRDAVSESILSLIRSGELKPGTRLPSEPQLIAMTGVSRSSVREAIRSLETMGLVEIRRGKGTFIREIDTGGMTDAQMLLMLADRKVLENLVEVRETLEPLMARLAAERATDEDIAALRHHLEGMLHARDHELWRPGHLAFHQALAEATHNIILTKIWSLITMFLKDSPLVTGTAKTSLPRVHETLLEAMAAHAEDMRRTGLRDFDGLLEVGEDDSNSGTASR